MRVQTITFPVIRPRQKPKEQVQVKCVNCGSTKWVGPCQEMPFCEKDYGPMYAIAARVTR